LKLFPQFDLQGDRSRKPYCQGCLRNTQGSVGRASVLYQDLFADPSLH
jgi:hypothetical protein